MFSTQFQPQHPSYDRFPPRVEPYPVVVLIDDRGRLLAVRIGMGIDLRTPVQSPADPMPGERVV